MRRREGREGLPFGSLLLANGISRGQKQAKSDGNQDNIAVSAQVRTLLLPIGIFRVQVQSSHREHLGDFCHPT